MEEFLDAAFSKRLRFGVPLGAHARVSVSTGNIFCWSCGAEAQIVTSVGVTFGPHAYRFSVPDLDAYQDLFELIGNHLPRETAIGVIKRRFSRTQARHYLSNGCSHCDALIGEFHEHDTWDNQEVICSFTIHLTERWKEAILSRDESGPGWGVYSRD
jgi:competence protein CoiA